MLSKKSGRKSIEYKLRKLNIVVDEKQLDKILYKVKDLGIRNKGLVNDEEFWKIVDLTIYE